MSPDDGRSSRDTANAAGIRREVILRQHVGTHLRVVKRIHETVAPLAAEIHISSALHRAHAGSVLDLMQLAARPGDRLVVEGRGAEAARAVAFVVQLLHASRWDAKIPDG